MSGMRGFGDMVGKYWAQDNARFDATNPNSLQRMWRGVNPITGLGSSIGDVYEGVSNGRPGQAALGAASAVPLFGWARMLKTPVGRAAVAAQGLRGGYRDAATQAASTMYDEVSR
jgi:hypothetical protein